MTREDPNMPNLAAADAQAMAMRHGPAALELLDILSRTTKGEATVAQATRLIRQLGPQAYLHHVAEHDAPTFCALLGEILKSDSEASR
jgi:hypothetical protein